MLWRRWRMRRRTHVYTHAIMLAEKATGAQTRHITVRMDEQSNFGMTAECRVQAATCDLKLAFGFPGFGGVLDPHNTIHQSMYGVAKDGALRHSIGNHVTGV